jgi:hypothetical protein
MISITSIDQIQQMVNLFQIILKQFSGSSRRDDKNDEKSVGMRDTPDENKDENASCEKMTD